MTKQDPQKKCWPFCPDETQHCVMKKLGLCREDVPRYQSPPPNTGCLNITELRFGSSYYEEEIEEFAEAHSITSRKSLMNDWRKSDSRYRMALIDINEDPDLILSGESAGCSPLWDAFAFEEMVLNDKLSMGLAMVACDNLTQLNTRDLIVRLGTLFRTKLHDVMMEKWDAMLDIPLLASHQKEDIRRCINSWGKAKTLFQNYGASIVANWLIELQFESPEYWIPHIPEISKMFPNADLPEGYSMTGSQFILDNIKKDATETDREAAKKRSQNREAAILAMREEGGMVFGMDYL